MIAIIAVPRDFNASCNTLKTEILNSVTLITYKLRDVLFARNKAVSLLNT